MPRPLLSALSAFAAVIGLLILLRLTWSPDPTQSLYFRAQSLESAGQTALALRAYALISNGHPTSFYAPRALMRQGDLLAARGAQSGDETTLQNAVAEYARVVKTYPRDALVGEALRDAGQISFEKLRDLGGARDFYAQLLEKSGAKSDDAALATLQLGHIAIALHQGPLAQTLLQRVLRNWAMFPQRAAEAQFTLGVAYETIFKNRDWATRAYKATISRYPNSLWANQARQKLGLILYNPNPPARRVLIQIDALPDDGSANGSLWSTLKVILAAHGVEVSDATLGGWSLAPFYAGFDPKHPARVVETPLDAWENVVANAGLRLTVQSGGKTPALALKQLQDEIDSARAPLVYFEQDGAKIWALCVGYDSERGEVMLQSRGARFDTLSAKSFGAAWGAKSSFGQPWTLISLVPIDQKTRPKPSLTPTPVPNSAPSQIATGKAATPNAAASNPATSNAASGISEEQVSAPDSQNAPTFVWELPKISLAAGDNRARARAATILSRPRSGEVLLGAAGLEQLALELDRIATARPASPATVAATPLPAATAAASDVPRAEGDSAENAAIGNSIGNAASGEESPYAPDATATPLATTAPLPELRRTLLRDDEARATALLGFLGAPARGWAQNRRDAAAWCDEASKRSKDPNWQRARDALRLSATAIESAISLAPASLATPLGTGDRAQIGEAARQIERAAAAERAAARALSGG